jgi:hypothetical protein
MCVRPSTPEVGSVKVLAALPEGLIMFFVLKICFWMVIAFIGMGIVGHFWKQTLIAVAVIGVGCVGLFAYAVIITGIRTRGWSQPVASTPEIYPPAKGVDGPWNDFDYVNGPGETPRTAFDPNPTPSPYLVGQGD